MQREALATANRPDDLLEQQAATAQRLNLLTPTNNEHNAWGPVFTSSEYDLRIDKQVETGRYVLYLLHKLQPGGWLDKLRRH